MRKILLCSYHEYSFCFMLCYLLLLNELLITFIFVIRFYNEWLSSVDIVECGWKARCNEHLGWHA